MIKKIIAAFIFVFFVGSTDTSIDARAADAWITQFKLKSAIRKMKKKGMYPASVKCRNSPKAKVMIKPEIKVSWKKNSRNRDWALYMYKGQLDFRPGPSAQWNKWRRAYSKIIRHGAATYRCSLFYLK